MTLIQVGALAVLGSFTGFAAGLLGIGGGMIMVPFLTFLFTMYGFPAEVVVHVAIATSMATILFTSLSSVRAHHKRGAVRWDIVMTLVPGILICSRFIRYWWWHDHGAIPNFFIHDVWLSG